ncbi:MAG: hypothetical protein IT237_01010 [Bacteroidia bacterium]|nr:hypothetical protein [Bacteroidia bacterium]
MATTIVKVYSNSYRQWVRRVRVRLSIDGVFAGGMTQEVYTDDSGTAIIKHSSTGMATVFLNGKDEGRMRVPDSKVFYIS